MKKLLALLIASLMVVGLVACGGGTSSSTPAPASTPSQGSTPDEGGEDNTPSGDPIVIGALQDTTGATSSLGKMVEAGARWAMEEINQNGGIDGRPVEMITYDTKGDVNEAITAFTRAVDTDGVVAVIGPPVANIAMAIGPISEEYNVPVLGFAVDPKCQVKEDGEAYKNMFAFQPSALSQGSIMGNYALKNGFETFGVIYNEGNAYSVSLLTPFVEAVEAGGGTVVNTVSYTANDNDYKTLLSSLISANVDAIYAPNYTQELILIVQQARGLGYEGAFICGLDANPPFNNLLGESCDNIYYINNVDNTDANLVAMEQEVLAANGIEVTNKFFLGYDVMYVLKQIIEEVGDDSVAIRDAVENLKNFEGLTGSITIDPATHMPTGLEMVMFTYEGTDPVMLERYSA